MARSEVEIRAQLLRHGPWWLCEPEDVLDAIVRAIAAQLARAEGAVDSLHDRTFIDLADGSWLDQHGRERGVPRFTEETDTAYRPRVKAIEDKVTRTSILAAVDAVLLEGTSLMEEHTPDAAYAVPNGTDVNKQGYAGVGRAYDDQKCFTIIIEPQRPDPKDTSFAAPNGSFDDYRSFSWEDAESGAYPQPGSYPEPDQLNAAEIYSRVFREIDRLRAAGVTFRVVVE